MAVGVVGSGSNLLVSDDGFHGLAIKLDGDLATIEREGEAGLLCGGGAGCRRPRPVPPAGASPGSSSGSTSPAPPAGRCG